MTVQTNDASAASGVPIRVGCMLIAVTLAALGVLSIYTGDFAYTWQPVPEDLPARALAARITGVLLVAVSALLVLPQALRASAVALAIVAWTWLLLLHIPNLITGANWLGAFEFLLPVGASMAFLGVIAQGPPRPGWRGWFAGRQAIVFGRICFGIGLIGCGMSHFIYLEGAAQLIPAWMPARTFLTYLTGVGHIAAGASLLAGVLLRVAIPLLLVMLASFVLLLHVPRVLADPSRLEWTMLIVSSLFNGTAWLIAAALLQPLHSATPSAKRATQDSAEIAAG